MTKKSELIVYSAAGLVVLFLALIGLNYLSSALGLRADLTEGSLYTLSDGTRKVLKSLDAPVKLKLYVSRGEEVPVGLRSFAQRVDDMVKEFKAASGGKLEVERYDPKPDSEEVDAAQLDGVEPQQLATGESFYLGLAVSRLDRKQVIPALNPTREQLLEYDMTRAISAVGASSRPKIGLMSSLPVAGAPANQMMRMPEIPAWVLYNELRRQFDVEKIDMQSAEIDKKIDVLLLIHPRDLTSKTEYALDQFVLRGGKLIAFVDSYTLFDQIPAGPGQPPQQGSISNLPTLFKAWGVTPSEGKVLADVVFASGGGQRYSPTVLNLNRTALNRDDVVTNQLETLLYPFGGAFEVKPAAGLSMTPLITASKNSMLVEHEKATEMGDATTANFKPAGKDYHLALRLSGKFKSAFPDGVPPDPYAKDSGQKDAKGDAKGKDAKGDQKGKDEPPAKPAALKESAKDNSVILVADVDMLADGAAVDIQEIFGQKIVIPSNGNLAFAINLVEQVGSGEALSSLRARAAAFRPLTVVRELEADAQKQYFGKIQVLEGELQKTSKRLEELRQSKSIPGASAQIMSPEQQAELDRFRKQVTETRKELKEVRKTLRRDAEQLVFWTKVANIALMPLLVALAGLAVALTRRRRVRQAALTA